MIYSLIETCKRIGADPFAHLRDVLERLPSTAKENFAELPPRAWLESRRSQHAPVIPA